MSSAIGAYVGVSKQTEMLLMTVLALWVNIFDMAIFEISSNLDQVWNVEIDKEIFNPNAEYIIRMLLSGVVLIRTFTLHLYIAFLIAVFWPVCFGTRPTLMLPWLVVSAIKNLGTGMVSIGTGGYTCMIYGPLRPACLRFLLSQLIDLSPSFYMWFVGLSLYCDLKKPKSVNRLQVKAMEDQELNVALRRRKVKSMIDEDILRQQFESRSFQKKFLGTSAVEVNEFINRCSYDNLKNKFSRSLDSLLDVLTVQTELLDIDDSEPLDIDSSSTLQQKTAKLLGISMDEIDYIKQNRQTRTDFPVYPVQPQKKIQTISLINSRYESPAKLLPETSLYSPPNIKPIRVTKSELKSAKDFSKIESEFIQSAPEKEMQVHDLTQDESFESLTKMQTQLVYQSTNSLFKSDDVTDDTANVKITNLLTKKASSAKEHGGEYSNKNRDRYYRKQDRGKLEENAQVEIPPKYKFCNTMSDKSHYLLDEHCFLFDKDLMIMKKGASKVDSVYVKRKRSIDHNQNQSPTEEKQRRLSAPKIDVVPNTKTRFKDNVINKKSPLDGKLENKNMKPSLRKIKEEVINKKILKQSEKTQAIKKKIANTRKMPSKDYSNIPVLHRNTKCKNDFLNLDTSKIATKSKIDNANKFSKNSICQEKKLYTIEENKDVASVSSCKEKKNNDLCVDKVTEENKSIINEIEKNYSSVLKQEEKKNETISNEKTMNYKEENIWLKNAKLNSIEESKISVSAEIERINQKHFKDTPKKDIIKNMENKKTIASKTNFFNKSSPTEFRIPVPFLSIKHSSVRMTTPQKEAIYQEEKIHPREQNKSLFNTSQALSEKILQIIKEKNKLKTTDKISVEDIFKQKINKTELFKTVHNNDFEFTAKMDEKGGNLPVKSASRNKQLEFHFKEKITKTKDNKMEDLFKKKTVTERKDSKTSDKDKLGFPSYFSNKINRMITDACQIRKKSCKKINLFIKVPANSSSKQRNKLSTIELFRKQSPPKINLFDITRKLSIGKLDIPPCKLDKCKDRSTNSNKAKTVSNRIEINLFNTEAAKNKKEINLFDTAELKTKKEPIENLFSSHKCSSISSLKSLSNTSLHHNKKPPEKEKQISEDMRDDTSLISSFMSFKPDEYSCIEKLNSSHKTNKAITKVEESIGVTKTKPFIPIYEATKEAHLNLSLVKPDIANDINKIIVSYQKLNTNTVVQKANFPIISENRSCKKLSEQAMNKIVTLTKIDNLTKSNEPKTNISASNNCFSTIVNKSSCKRLSEQAINKIISLTNTGYSNFPKESTDNKLNVSMANCKKLSDYAIDKLLAITSPNYTLKTNMTGKKASHLIFTKTQIENKEEIIDNKNDLSDIKNSGIPMNVTKSENLNHTISNNSNKYTYDANFKEDSDDFHKVLKTTQSEKSNNLNLNELNSLETKVNRKSSIPVVREDNTNCEKLFKTIPSLTKIKDKNEVKSSMEKTCSDSSSDLKWNKSNIIALVEDAVRTKSVSKKNTPIREKLKKDSAHNTPTNNIFLNNSNPDFVENISVPEENQNLCTKNTELKHSKASTQLDSSIQIDMLNITQSLTKAQRVEKNCKWISQDCINIFSSNAFTEEKQNTPNIKDEKIYVEVVKNNAQNFSSTKSESPRELKSVHKKNQSPKTENLNNSAMKEEIECYTSEQNECVIKINSHSNVAMLTAEAIQSNPKYKENNCKWTPQCCIQLIPSNNCVPAEENTLVTDTNIAIIDEEENDKNVFLNSNNEYQTNLLIIKVEKECQGTSQHRIKLISSTDKNCGKNSDKNEEQITQKSPNVIKIKHEYEGSLQNNNKLLSSLLYETAYDDSNLPVKETKVCRGTSHHNIKLISSLIHESLSETNISRNAKISSQTKDDLYIPLKEQKVCRGSSQNYVKLISLSKEEFASNTNFSHKEALSNILKEYQSVPIMKEEKVCKGTSKHKIKLVSSYKKDCPNKINLFHAETEYKNNKNENITIIKEEKICEGTLHHSIKLVSSSKNDAQNKTIFIVQEQLPKKKETISVAKEDCKNNLLTNKPSHQTNVFVNVNTANGKQNFTVIQKQNDDNESLQSGANQEINLFAKDKMTNTDESNIYKTEENHLDKENHMETFRRFISNTIQDFFENETEKVIDKTDTNFISANEESNAYPLIDIKSSTILSSLIDKVETSLKLQESKKEDFFDEMPDDINMSSCSRYHSNQIDFGCQTSTLSKKVLENNPNEITKKISRTKSITKSTSAKSYQDLNLQKLAFTMTTNKNSNSKLETKSINENLSKDEKKDSTIVLHSRSSRNASYVSIHKERLEKAKSLESDLNKSVILQNCAFLEDGYTRLYNLLGVKQENFDIKKRKNFDTSFNF